MLGRPPNVPRRKPREADFDLEDIQGNVLRGYTHPAAIGSHKYMEEKGHSCSGLVCASLYTFVYRIPLPLDSE